MVFTGMMQKGIIFHKQVGEVSFIPLCSTLNEIDLIRLSMDRFVIVNIDTDSGYKFTSAVVYLIVTYSRT